MLLNTIKHAGRKIFLHFHDAAEFVATEHPRGEAGKFVKKGTGTASPKPKAAAGAVVVNPIAKVLKEHGYVKQKGSNIYQGPSGHEIEAHAASEGQKWLTGWTHNKNWQTGSGAGKLSKYLASVKHDLPPDMFEEKKEEAPVPPAGEYKTGQFKPSVPTQPTVPPSPLTKVHNLISTMAGGGFVPTAQSAATTTYEHPTKGKIVVKNTAPESGAYKGKVGWQYYKPGDTTPTDTGKGVSNGMLEKTVNYYNKAPVYTPPATKPVSMPLEAKISSGPELKIGYTFPQTDPAMKYKQENANKYTLTSGEHLITSLNSDIWEITGTNGGTIVQGAGQKELDDAFEKLHPRGEGGKFIAKPGSLEAKILNNIKSTWLEPFAESLTSIGFSPQEETTKFITFAPADAEKDLSVVFNKGDESWTAYSGEKEASGFGLKKLEDKVIEYNNDLAGVGSSKPAAVSPAVVSTEEISYHFTEGTGYKQENATSTKFSNDLYLVRSKESDKFEIMNKEGITLAQGNTQQELDDAVAKHLGGAWTPPLAKPQTPMQSSILNDMKNAGKSSYIDQLTQAGFEPASFSGSYWKFVSPGAIGATSVYIPHDDGSNWILSDGEGNKHSGFGSDEFAAKMHELGYWDLGTLNEPDKPPVQAGVYTVPQLAGLQIGESQEMLSGNTWVKLNNEDATLVTKPNYEWKLYKGSLKDGQQIASGDTQTELNEALQNYVAKSAGAKPEVINQVDHDALVAAGYKSLGKAPWGDSVYVYGKDDGSIVLASDKSNLPGNPTIFPIHPTALKDTDGESYNALVALLGGKTPQVGEVPSGVGQPALPSTKAPLMTSLFKPLEAEGFQNTTSNADGSVVGLLKNDPNGLKAVYTVDPVKGAATFAWQLVGENGQNVEFTGSPTQIYAQIKAKIAEIKAASAESPADKAEHWTKTSPVPKELNGVPFSMWAPPANWQDVAGTNEHLQEPQITAPPGKKISCGLLIEEPDGRVWIVKPKGAYGGYQYTFPKGGQEPGMSLQATAIKEAWEESGLKADITGYAGDYQGDTSVTRYYYAKRTGGIPTQYGEESEQVSLVPKSELGKYLNKPRDLQIMKDHFVPKAIGRPIHLESMKKIGGKLGSNAGGIYETESGKRYYVKLPKSELHTKNELLAADLMSKAGGGTLQYHPIIDKDGKLNVGTEWQQLHKDNVSKLTPAEKKKAQKDFAINAWLANWDAAGTGGDNTGITQTGKAVTLDVGGALLFRAQGDPKGAAFGDTPTEWDTLRDKTKNPDAFALYGDMTPEQLKESTEKLNNVTNQDIADAVHAHFDPDSDPIANELIEKLIKRRDKLISYGAVIQVAPKAAPAAPTAPAYKPPTPPPPPAADVFAKKYSAQHWTNKPEYRKLLDVAPEPTKKQGNALVQYTGGSYRQWNKALRTSTGEDSGGYPTKDLMEYLAKASFPAERTVTRRVDDSFSNWLIGQAESGAAEFTDHGFASSDHWSGKLTLRIKVPQGAQAAAVGNYSSQPPSSDEDEIIIQAGSHYRILAFNKQTLTMDVELVRSGMSEYYASKLGRPAGVVHKKTIGL